MTKLAHRRMAVAAGLAAVALVAAACGDDDGDSASPSASTSVVVSETSTTATDVTSSAPSGESATSESAASDDASANASATEDASASKTAGEDSATEVTITGAQGREVTLTGPIATRYKSATDAEKKDLGKPLDGDRNAGTRDSGVVYQQFEGGAITAKNGDAGTPAFITWGKIRDAWNVPRAADGTPETTGTNGSAGPLGTATSDEQTQGDLKVTTFEHGKVTFNTKTGKVEVTVNGKVVPSGL
ncbi:hypothetical protein [Gordonia sp. (in: high G+C Gram-positive bacteria)]|jgi:hypothetical protein|uniref:LGFP repeat-containing protein n=1 Tax=Gordonia sp. (in: high G+C Gram-positive bacteria) TaxID=84139 RepID=UPI0025C6CDBF|nr:hypothetical protein [Gordonia sp. (in: high G+C Gram-positive bacteria)]HMS75458.1 hypothetical protein [Gordonia sp. (in: high G+C Gram-positive bacteria)]